MEHIHQDAPGRNKLPPLPGEADPDAVLARRLRALREIAELTQRQLADQMTGAGYQMHQTTIAKIEAGQRPVIVGEAVALARIIGVGVADLLSEPVEGDGELADALAELGSRERGVHEMEARAARAAVDAQDAQTALDGARAQLEAARWHVDMLRRKTS